MADAELTQRLDTMIAILRIAHRGALDDARTEVMSDTISGAILETASDWMSAGALAQAVVNGSNESERTVKRRVAKLLADGLLEKRGSGAQVDYRVTGVI